MQYIPPRMINFITKLNKQHIFDIILNKLCVLAIMIIVMQCCAVLCCAVLCCAVLCCAVLCCAVLCCAVLCCAVQRHTNTTPHHTTPHHTTFANSCPEAADMSPESTDALVLGQVPGMTFCCNWFPVMDGNEVGRRQCFHAVCVVPDWVAQKKIIFGSCELSIQTMWPTHRSWAFMMSDSMFWNVRSLQCWDPVFPMYAQDGRQQRWNRSSTFSCLLYIIQVSQACIKEVRTIKLYTAKILFTSLADLFIQTLSISLGRIQPRCK